MHFALAASFFDRVRVVGPVGDDFGADELAVLRSREVETDDIEHVAGGRTFFWRAHYDFDLNVAHTEETQLNVFGDFQPKLSPASRDCDVLFLANIQPDLQRQVREQCPRARLVAMDSMNLWIETARESLRRTIEGVDCVLFNDAELRQLTGQPSLLAAAREVMRWGPSLVVAKRGEYGAALFSGHDDGFFALPAFPLETVTDPDRRGRLVRRRVPGRAGRRGRRPVLAGRAASRDGLWHRAGVIQRRGVRHRAGAPSHR